MTLTACIHEVDGHLPIQAVVKSLVCILCWDFLQKELAFRAFWGVALSYHHHLVLLSSLLSMPFDGVYSCLADMMTELP